jgi:hypothetical protein
MTIVGCNVVARGVQRRERRVGTLPPRSPTPHEVIHVPLAHSPVRDPTTGLPLVMAHLPRLHDRDSNVCVRCLERPVLPKAAARDHTRGAVMPLIVGHGPGWRGRLHRLDQRGVVACCAPKNGVAAVVVPGLDGRRMGPQAVFGHDALEVRVILAPRGHDACGGVAFTSMCGGAILVDEGFWQPGNHGPPVRMAKRRAHHGMSRRRAAVAVDRWPTCRAVQRLGGNRPRAIACQEIAVIKTHQRGKRLAALAWPQDPRAQGASGGRANRLKARAPRRVTGHTRHPVDGGHMALGPVLVQGKPRRRCEGTQGQSRHERIGQRTRCLATAMIRDGGEAASHPAQEGIGGEMCASLRSGNRHGTPPA